MAFHLLLSLNLLLASDKCRATGIYRQSLLRIASDRIDNDVLPFLVIGFMVKMHNNQNFMCTNGSSSMEGFSKIVGQQPPVVGVIGDQSSDVTIQVGPQFN